MGGDRRREDVDERQDNVSQAEKERSDGAHRGIYTEEGVIFRAGWQHLLVGIVHTLLAIFLRISAKRVLEHLSALLQSGILSE